MNDYNKKNNDIIDAEFITEGEIQNKSDKDPLTGQAIIETEKFHFNHENSSNYNKTYQEKFNTFFYSFSNSKNLAVRKPSLFQMILLLPFILIALIFILIIALISFVIFLPKIFKIFRKKGISGLKMDYNILRGLFSQFKMK